MPARFMRQGKAACAAITLGLGLLGPVVQTPAWASQPLPVAAGVASSGAAPAPAASVRPPVPVRGTWATAPTPTQRRALGAVVLALLAAWTWAVWRWSHAIWRHIT